MSEPMGLYARVGLTVWLRQYPRWSELRLVYRYRRLRWNTWRLMHWYRVTP